jgi:predicted HicB family RNase H-like nuclease
MKALSHRGYSAVVEFDPEDLIFTGRVANVNDVVGFHADSVVRLLAAFREAVDDYLATCAKLGKEPDKPFSGKIMLRVDPELHARASLAARASGLSLNQWGERVLAKAAAGSGA